MNDVVDNEALTTLKEIMGDDFGLLLDTFLNDASERLAQLQSVQASGDADALRKLAHSLKGSCANIGAHSLASVCQVIETSAHKGNLAVTPPLLQQLTEIYPRVVEALETYR